MNNITPNSTALLRAHLQDKSAGELITLLLELIQQVDEPTRQRFWTRLAPPGLATADLRYPTPEIFLAELDKFVAAVQAGEYFDEEAQEYYGEDPADRGYHGLDYDLDDHAGLVALRKFLAEADSYFQAGRYDIAAVAYEHLIAIALDGQPYETLGVDSPLSELGRSEETLAERYFLSLHQSRSATKFYEAVLAFLARHDQPYRQYTAHFLALVGSEQRDALCVHLEEWADGLDRQEMQTFPTGIPFQLRLLIRLYTEADRMDKVEAVRQRFRRRYLALYSPLLADREAAQDWSTVIAYGQELLALMPPSTRPSYYYPPVDTVDINVVRTHMARAYEALGDPKQAFTIYQPVFDSKKDFVAYATAKRLAGAIAPERERDFTRQVLTTLRSQLPQMRYLLCQVYLSEGQFDEAYALAEKLIQYSNLDVIKLVAKAHLLAAFGPEASPDMGPNLKELYAKVAQSDKESVQFLREQQPGVPATLPRAVVLDRAETLYRRLMQLHIDNGRKTYATAAYYCALLGEIAAFDGRKAAFDQFYQELLSRYARHRALRAELAAKVS